MYYWLSQKHTARALAEKAEVPVLPGSDLLTSEEDAVARASEIGLPVLLKATGARMSRDRLAHTW